MAGKRETTGLTIFTIGQFTHPIEEFADILEDFKQSLDALIETAGTAGVTFKREDEPSVARFQGKHAAEIAKRLKCG